MAHDLSSLRPYKNTETLKKSSMTQNKVSFQGLYLQRLSFQIAYSCSAKQSCLNFA